MIIGVSQQMVSEWETDSEPVAEKNWPALDEALGIECATLEMPPANGHAARMSQVATGNSTPQQSFVGNNTMVGNGGITCSGYDDTHHPTGFTADEFVELLYLGAYASFLFIADFAL